MITRITSANADKYTALFGRANRALAEAQLKSEEDGNSLGIELIDNDEGGKSLADPITTIEKYFYYLKYLIKLGSAEDVENTEMYNVLHSEGRRYTMLPVFSTSKEASKEDDGERLFDIDANTRKISIPQDFVSNGVSVQGDKFAETLYFMVDRFYDAMDLNSADIYVQWTTPDGVSGVSIPWVIDIKSIPNKIIFGWALSSDITKVPGNLQFSVRFYQWNDNTRQDLRYSLSTLTHSVNIKPALDFELSKFDYLAECLTNNDIISRIKNSKTVVVDNEEAEMPIYVYNAEELALENEAFNATYDEEAHITYIDLFEGENGELSRELKVQAYSPDSGIISYSWTFCDINSNLSSVEGGAGEPEDVSQSKKSIQMIPTKDTELKAKVYYKQITKDGSVGYEEVDPDELVGSINNPKEEGWFEKFSVLKVNRIGKYNAIATNYKTKMNEKSLKSDVIIVPEPSAPRFLEPIGDTVSFDLPSHKILKEEEGELITLEVGVENEERENRTNKGKLSYAWFMKKNKDDEYVPVVFEDGIELDPEKNGARLVINYDPNQKDPNGGNKIEGFYKVQITNSKNGGEASIESSESRISYAPTAPEIEYPAFRKEFYSINLDTKRTDLESFKKAFTVRLDEEWLNTWNISDEISYQWIKSSQIPDITLEEGQPDDGGVDIIMVDGADGEGSQTATFIPNNPGNYYCQITNKKNGQTAIAYTGIVQTVS